MLPNYYTDLASQQNSQGYGSNTLNPFSNFLFQQYPIYSPIVYPNPLCYYPYQFTGPSISSSSHSYQIKSQPKLLNSLKIQKESANNIFQKDSNFEDQNKASESMSNYEQSRYLDESADRKMDNKISKRYKQNAGRNILTNIGNQLITFLGNRDRSQRIYLRVNQNAKQQQISQFYGFIHKLRKRKKSPIYFNQKKMKQIWYPKAKDLAQTKNYIILRKISLIYIQQLLPLLILNSSKIKQDSKKIHISAIRKFLFFLRYQQMI